MELQNKNIYRLDYIGQDIFELNDGVFNKHRKSGSIYIFPKYTETTGTGMISNFCDFNGSPLRVRSFEDYVAIEPSGIIVKNENINLISWDDIYTVDKETISPRNSLETNEVSLWTFVGNYLESLRYTKDISREDMERSYFDLVFNQSVEGNKTKIKPYDFVCLFVDYLSKNGIKDIDLNILNSYLYGRLLKGESIPYDRETIHSQFITLIYNGILYSDYEKYGKSFSKAFIDYYNKAIDCHFEETQYAPLNYLKIDDSPLSKQILENKYRENLDNYSIIEEFADDYLDFYNYYLELSSRKQIM